MRYAVLGILASALISWAGSVVAQERGIGVTPAKIEVGQKAEWPYTVPVTVTNLSSETENFEITFEKDEDTIVSVSPGRFSLDAGASAHVLAVFEEPRSTAEGLVKIVSLRTSPEGFTTGTGVKIPFHIETQSDSARFLAGVSEALGSFGRFHRLFGAGMMLATLVLLWYICDMARLWIFNSGKQ